MLYSGTTASCVCVCASCVGIKGHSLILHAIIYIYESTSVCECTSHCSFTIISDTHFMYSADV